MAVFKEVTKVLSLHEPVLIAENPDRPNIVYSICIRKDVETVASDISCKLLALKSLIDFPKTIVFCQRWVINAQSVSSS